MSQEVLCSFLMPTRGSPNLTLKSLKSIVYQSSDTISYEVLIAIDSNDNENLNIIPQIYEIFQNSKKGIVKIMITKRYHYYGLHRYYNLLSKISKGELLFLWNNDCIMLDSHIHREGINQDHTLSKWDLTLKQDYENLEPYVALLYPTEVYMEGDARGGRPHLSNCGFPIILKNIYELIGHLSVSPLNDAYLTNICNFKINNKSTIKISRIMIGHSSPFEGETNQQETFQKASKIHYSDEIQRSTLDDRGVVEEYLRDKTDESFQSELPFWNKYVELKENPDTYGIPQDHINKLKKLRDGGFNPSVIYDIGSAVGHWREVALEIWPDAQIFMFEANEDLEHFYDYYGWEDYHIGLLSNENDKSLNYYYNEEYIGGNSYYKENTETYSWEKFRVLKSEKLETLIANKGWPMPDLIKLDVQGAEIDILNGCGEILKHPEYMIVELQHMNYNEGASLAEESIGIIEKLGYELSEEKFSAAIDMGIDADYLFVNKDYIGENRR